MRSLGLNPTNKEIADLIAEVDKSGRLDGFPLDCCQLNMLAFRKSTFGFSRIRNIYE